MPERHQSRDGMPSDKDHDTRIRNDEQLVRAGKLLATFFHLGQG